MDTLIIINRRPGMIRGGRSHPPVATYTAEEAATFTVEQLADIAAEPEMTMAVGTLITAEQVDDVATLLAASAAEAQIAAEAEKKGKKAKPANGEAA